MQRVQVAGQSEVCGFGPCLALWYWGQHVHAGAVKGEVNQASECLLDAEGGFPSAFQTEAGRACPEGLRLPLMSLPLCGCWTSVRVDSLESGAPAVLVAQVTWAGGWVFKTRCFSFRGQKHRVRQGFVGAVGWCA